MGPPDDAVSGASFLERLRTRVVAAATPVAIAIALGLYLASVAALSIADLHLGRHAPGVRKLDLSPGFGHTEAVAVLTGYGPQGRRAYAIRTLVDSVMPLMFALVTLLAFAVALPTLILSLLVIIGGAVRRRAAAAQ